jgi:hypothetical protein
MKNRNAGPTDRLRELERVIGRGHRSVRKVADAVTEIRDKGLYREYYPTFEEYWQKQWGPKAHTRSHPSLGNEAAAAYHEAGHAVVKSCLGLGHSGISIVPDNDSWGRVESGKPEKPMTWAAVDRGDRWHSSRLLAERWVMVFQAGDVAQRHHDPASVGLSYSRSDFVKCNALLLNYDPDKENPNADLHYDLLQKWTESLIEQHWHLVEAVAKALLEQRELSGSQVRDVIHAANQIKGHKNTSNRQKESPA